MKRIKNIRFLFHKQKHEPQFKHVTYSLSKIDRKCILVFNLADTLISSIFEREEQLLRYREFSQITKDERLELEIIKMNFYMYLKQLKNAKV